MGIFKDTKDDKKKKKDIGKPEEEKSMKDLYTASGEMKKKDAKKVSGQAYRVLIKPMVTEKATNLGSSNQYVFMVGIDTNKIEVAKAIQEVYGVKPISVNIIKIKGKKVNRGRITGKRKDFKKAVITLKKGDTISVYEGV
jgi:large subunit ribosomal protein L23